MDVMPGWYIVKPAKVAACEIIEIRDTVALDRVTSLPDGQHWGPFASPHEAIAKRVGLIRAGKCQPQ
jgi:hypothetical protein